MSRVINDLTGKKFGILTVIKQLDRNKHGHINWLCLCSCGVSKIITGESLKSGGTVSCGCYIKKLLKNLNTKHGDSRRGSVTVEYTTWVQMIARCYNSKNKRYVNYNNRGVTVCEEWKNSFSNFLKDMGRRPSKDHSLDRIDNDGNYCKENCRWATEEIQQKNKTNNHWIEYDGKRMVLQDWAKELDASHSNILRMLKTKSFNEVYIYYMHNRRKKRKM